MLKRLRGTSPEGGAVAVIVAILVIVLFGFTALAVDVARMYGERRELQRTADASALAGARELVFSPGSAMTKGEEYIDKNPTIYHPSTPEGPGFSPSTGDSVIVGTCEVPGLGVSLPCVTSRVVAPKRGEAVPEASYGFNFLFAGVLGVDDRAISATSTAVVGRGAPGGDQLVPWLAMDCPHPKWDGTANGDSETVEQIAARLKDPSVPGGPLNPNCTFNGYDYGYVEGWDLTSAVSLFLAGGNTGNFQAADYPNTDGTCPLPNGYWNVTGSGKNGYFDILSKEKTACNIDQGARVWTEPGGPWKPTGDSLDDRAGGTLDCMNQPAFEATIDDPVPGDGFVSIKPGGLDNPCLVALALVVHPQEDAPGLKSPPTVGNIPAMQERLVLQNNGGPKKWDGRFAIMGTPGEGGKELMLVRRFAYFYLTEKGNAARPFKGLFLRAFDSYNADLSGGACDPTIDAVCVVKLIPTD
jgi:hypothetical protein